MTCTVLQHLTDSYASEVCAAIKRLVPKGPVLIIEKTEAPAGSRADLSQPAARHVHARHSPEGIRSLSLLPSPFTMDCEYRHIL